MKYRIVKLHQVTPLAKQMNLKVNIKPKLTTTHPVLDQHSENKNTKWKPTPVTDYQIMKIVYQLKNTESTGHDDITLK